MTRNETMTTQYSPGHDHDHDHHHGHSHSHAPKVDAANRRRVGLAALLTGLFVVVEVVGGIVSGSLALLADAGHMVTDFAALAMAWGGFVIAQRPATWRHTFGYDRVAILVAFVNGLTLFAVAGWIVWEAVERLSEPGNILAGPMLWVAVAGLVVNVLVFWILMGADRANLNIRGAMLHVLGDLLGSVAAIAAALIILMTGWVAADPVLSVLVALLILKSAWGLIRDSAHVLLQGAPKGVDVRAVAQDLVAAIDGLDAVDHVHVWSLTPERPMLTLDAYVGEGVEPVSIGRALKARLGERHGIEHATVNVMRVSGESASRCPYARGSAG
ncbi:cation diffusion facilitator family transporter [uncultured Algimonas sp.]|uniref:cation diffusion facilitator family transporter n=1 Tax=uncultured Algimonas sp. TaxID=1547920 RepID=UPI002610091D|nr:cation diffusion facilitator family transporter [uncultured Algimonas sp.]